jgi:hypothetical protein
MGIQAAGERSLEPGDETQETRFKPNYGHATQSDAWL